MRPCCKDKSVSQKDLLPVAAQKAAEIFPIAKNDTIDYASQLGVGSRTSEFDG